MFGRLAYGASVGGVAVVECPSHVKHAPAVEIQGGRPLQAFDQVARIARIRDSLQSVPGVEHYQPTEHGLAPVLRVHDERMVRFLGTAWAASEGLRSPGSDLLFPDTFFHSALRPRTRANVVDAGPLAEFGLYCFDTITGLGEASAVAAFGAVDTALTAAELVANESHRLVVALCRPPGHHVGRRLFGGGCYLNNAAIAAQWLRDNGSERVAILDVDFHHGNGTQDVFYADPSVLYVSLHGDPRRTFPYFTGYEDERGIHDGLGYNLNLPLPPWVAIADYRRKLERGLEAIAGFAPDFLVVSLGLDAMDGDPSGDGALKSDDFELVGRDISGLLVPTLAVLEGGYRLDTLGPSFKRSMIGLLSTQGANPPTGGERL